MTKVELRIENRLERSLKKRGDTGLLRVLPSENGLVDFCSNDYLGFARSEELSGMILGKLNRDQMEKFSGSTGSRLITGNSGYIEKLEQRIASYHNAEAGLIFNSGYDANVGLISSVVQKNDLIFYDELVHASLHDGIRLSRGKSFSFRHNDLNHLSDILNDLIRGNHKGSQVFVVVESVYSMDGDFAPLKDLAILCTRHGASLIVDEAHATGVCGKKGEGRVGELNIGENIFARIHTFGKALGCFGAIVLGSRTLVDYLVNYARTFIYTTALPYINIAAIDCAYELIGKSENTMKTLSNNIALFRKFTGKKLRVDIRSNDSPIQVIIRKGNERARNASTYLRGQGLNVRHILYPSVPSGSERLRLCIHSFNTKDEIKRLASALIQSP
ncbi:MAG: 8-amino-7-oxononanoate synthase [Bacteroidetes bacterium]|nr:8-amino-7-oxononanoate synthase [Bacteroidota bacterium]